MESNRFSDEPEAERAVLVRERLSLALMLVPLCVVGVFVLMRPNVWATDLAVFFSQENELLRSDTGWMLATVTLVAAATCAWIGVLGTREHWKANRRWQRGFLGSIAATLVAVLLNSWTMTQAIREGGTPDVGLAAFLTVCAMLYGVVCAIVTPRDVTQPWYPDDAEGGEEAETQPAGD